MRTVYGASPFTAPAGCYGYLNDLRYEQNNITKKEEDSEGMGGATREWKNRAVLERIEGRIHAQHSMEKK